MGFMGLRIGLGQGFGWSSRSTKLCRSARLSSERRTLPNSGITGKPRSVGFSSAMRSCASLWSGSRLALARRRGPLLCIGDAQRSRGVERFLQALLAAENLADPRPMQADLSCNFAERESCLLRSLEARQAFRVGFLELLLELGPSASQVVAGFLLGIQESPEPRTCARPGAAVIAFCSQTVTASPPAPDSRSPPSSVLARRRARAACVLAESGEGLGRHWPQRNRGQRLLPPQPPVG